MESKLIPGLCYDVSTEVAPHDFDQDADTWEYEGKEVLRGQKDPNYDHDVFWLYDEGVQRVGLVEYNPENSAHFHVLWFYDNPFATFFQEPDWVSTGETLWTEMPIHAYEYCLEHGIHRPEQVQRLTKKTILTLEDVRKGKRVQDVFSVFCVDSDCVMYRPPSDSALWLRLRDGDATAEPLPTSQSASALEA